MRLFRVNCPKHSLAWLSMRSRDFYKCLVKREIMSYRILPPGLCVSIKGIVSSNIVVYTVKGEALVLGAINRFGD
jgi:hypothetical protein